MFENKTKIYWGKSLNEKIKLFFGQEYFQSRIIRWLFFSGLFFNLVDWALLKFFLRSGAERIILHYNVYFGVDLTGTSQSAYTLPFIGVVVLFFNNALSFYFYIQKERVASYILLLTVLMAELSLLISVISVIIINY
jgi:hypothetical protein